MQVSLFQDIPRFGGKTYEAQDAERLSGQLKRVYLLMKDGQWRTLEQIKKVVGGSEAAVSARLRDLRKPNFGGHTVESKRIDQGLWKYRVVTN